MLFTQRKSITVGVDEEKGQIASLQFDGREYMHDAQKGWKYHEKVCFPVFGPVPSGIVRANGTSYPMDQHGIVPNLIPNVEETERGIALLLDYDGKPVANAKFKPGNGRPEQLSYLPFGLERMVSAAPSVMQVITKISNPNKEQLPYIFAWHPAFAAQGDDPEAGVFRDANGKDICTHADLLNVKPGNVEKHKGSNVRYVNRQTGHGVRVFGAQMNQTVLWSNDESFVCIEPVTNEIITGPKQNYFEEGGFRYLSAPKGKDGNRTVQEYAMLVEPF